MDDLEGWTGRSHLGDNHAKVLLVVATATLVFPDTDLGVIVVILPLFVVPPPSAR